MICYTNSDYLFSVVGLNCLVESVGLLTPPGFDAVPSTSAACEPCALSTFKPCLTSSPGGPPQSGRSQTTDDSSVSRGKRPRICLSTNNGSISRGKRLRLDDSCKSAGKKKLIKVNFLQRYF